MTIIQDMVRLLEHFQTKLVLWSLYINKLTPRQR